MKLPMKIQVGPLTYQVKRGPLVDWALGENFGTCAPQRTEILLASGVSGDFEIETLLHEIAHAINDIAGVGQWLDTDQEERLVRSISPYWLMVLRDNPKLVEAITR